MNINEQLESFLAELGVEMEQPEDRLYNGDSVPEISIFQASRDHYGVFYRLDIIDCKPELRIMVPVDKGDTKMDIYLVQLSEHMPLNTCFAEMSVYEGSAAYEHGREAALQHLLYASAEMMKQLFWSGDLQSLNFPPEIVVYPLLINDRRRSRYLR
ncbi:hypothetical protein EPA93_27985 [Ktedonosporobacter rubrisoli]|uniref:Uncharacterized protein n=1 Tax=Ktedonosporobacter rubrisoli TaxID=2509675 RepID=A0A4P6JW70_KTERU|nr:hypothetical protein [Ktedonosporobacter rubrisoli]QBD79610.1 hypothetical protein EPA93_27985 [Ktedonosporobacter rubrisoli]